MGADRVRYEVRVGALVSKAMLASFPLVLTPIAVPRNTVYRFRVAADRDLSDVLGRLIERDVQVVEIRRCPEPRRRRHDPDRHDPDRHAPDGVPTEAEDAAVLPFPRLGRPSGTSPRSFGADDAAPALRGHAAGAHHKDLVRRLPVRGARHRGGS